MDGVGLIGELVGQDIRVGHAHHHDAGGLGERAAVDEVCVGKMRVPVEVVVDGVVLAAALVFAAVGEVGTGYTEVVDEHGVVRAGAEGRNVRVRAVFCFGARLRRAGQPRGEPLTLPYGHVCFGVDHILGHAVDEVLERV